jgi:hypothetical protein
VIDYFIFGNFFLILHKDFNINHKLLEKEEQSDASRNRVSNESDENVAKKPNLDE